MTDIEKRAYNYAEAIFGDTDKYIEWCTARGGYRNGAKEQLKIDIEKACEWLKTNLPEVINLHDYADVKRDDFVKDFFNAMEGGAE